MKSTFLFADIGEKEFNLLTENLTENKKQYKRGELIYSRTDYAKAIGFIISGECEVESHTSDGNKLSLNILKNGDSFGILALFSDEDFPTEIRAKRNSEILFLDKSALISLIERSPRISLNLIKFLSRRVAFLNGKIDTVTQGSVDTKLASYLLSRARAEGDSSFSFNYKRCSEIINCGRASVYRSVKFFENNGYIKAENKKIYILDKEKLKEFLK